MKITRLQAENFKKLTAIDITPDGTMNVLSGANAQGKTSALDAIWSALAGGAASKVIDRPVKDGAEEAMVRVELGDLHVTRKWKGGKTTLTVQSADGARYSSGQAVLDKLIGKLTFDPLLFAGLAPKEQVKTLLELVELDFDPAELDAKRKAVFEARTDVNRSVKQYDGELAGCTPVPADTPDDEVSVTELLRQYRAAQDALKERQEISDNVTWWETQISEQEARIADLQAALAVDRKRQTVAIDRANLYTKIALPDLDAIQKQIDGAENTNANVRELQRQQDLKGRRDEMAARAEHLTFDIAEIDRCKADGLAAAVFPIEGLSFNDEGVLYNEVPFSQASSAERLRVSTAMGMALNPELRVMQIRDASLLDSGNLATLAAMAVAQDFQLWLEIVDESGSVGIVFEDGAVVPAAVAA